MLKNLNFNFNKNTPKYLQIVESFTDAIRENKLKKGDAIYSINELSDEYFISRDTVQKAYSILKERGIIISVKGKGFFVNRTDIKSTYRVLLIFNKISNYKKQIYNAFVEAMGTKATIDLKIHHFNVSVLKNIIENSLTDYDYFVVMPHFYENENDVIQILKKIPHERLVILDKELPYNVGKYASVVQDFKNDIYDALESGIKVLKKYKRLILIFPVLTPYPPEIIIGFRSFCSNNNFPYKIINEIGSKCDVDAGDAFVVIEETDMVTIIKACKTKKLKPGKDVGIISYNETPLKEILLDGITVISTDFLKMGKTAAQLILDNKKEQIKNPFSMILRKSL
jgi:DNA-binding transcriptional regulator YhcF (GntR family)